MNKFRVNMLETCLHMLGGKNRFPRDDIFVQHMQTFVLVHLKPPF